MSPDGERLATYVNFGVGIVILSPDGKYVKQIHRYSNFGLGADILAFFAGHNQLVTSPAAETNSQEDREKADQAAFSILDAESGKVLRSIPGPNPVGGPPENAAHLLAFSPDQNYVAVAYAVRDPLIGIYETNDWRLIATIRTHAGMHGKPHALAFSPDWRLLAVARGDWGGVEFYSVGTWEALGTLQAFDDPAIKLGPVVNGLVFSPNGSMLIVCSSSGGLFWFDANQELTAPGTGVPRQELPADPLRVFDVQTRKRIATLGGFPGVGINGKRGIAWSPNSGYLAFLDSLGALRLWNPLEPGLSVVAAQGRHSHTLFFSPDGSSLFADGLNGIGVFEVGPQKNGN
ncbi:MAG: hypothetical protein ABSG88_22470 [Bradyrhizobium sp.]